MNSQITNLIVIFGMMQVSKRVPFEDPMVLNYVRAMYIISNIIILGLYYFTSQKIKAKNDQTTLKYVEPAPPMSGEEPKLVTTTISEYDQSQLKTSLKSVLMGVGMMAVMHLYFKYTNPLLIQSILPLKSAFESKLVQIHVFGKPAIGDLKRPFKAAGLMGAMNGGADVKTDKKSLEAAEKTSRGGAKEE